jgi:hypothetical protein
MVSLNISLRIAMKNPWTKKNPFLSMWLSGANAITGAARGRATAAMKKESRTAMTKAMRQATDFWFDAMMPGAKKKRKRRPASR